MIVAIGIDLIEISRVGQIISVRGDRFRKRVYTEGEIAYCDGQASGAARMSSYAARFAAKEAAMKALGTGWGGGVAWREIEITAAESGAPGICLHGRALRRMIEIGARRAHVSLSHSREMAVAQVVLED
jgi:holo-[acyl-carrier protein] synthase